MTSNGKQQNPVQSENFDCPEIILEIRNYFTALFLQSNFWNVLVKAFFVSITNPVIITLQQYLHVNLNLVF